MTVQLRQKIKNGEDCFGLYISMADSTVIEMAAGAGFDFVRIDLEHTLFAQSELRELIRTANLMRLPVFVRLTDVHIISSILDAGADGVIVSQINSREKAEAAVQAAKFAPLGERGMALSQRSSGYGDIESEDYCRTSNENILLCVQIESKEGVDHADEILSLPGIDMVSTGRNDLSQSFGLPGQNTHPTVLAAEETIIQVALRHQVAPVLLVGSKRRKQELQKKGVTCFNIGRDTGLLYGAMKQQILNYKE